MFQNFFICLMCLTLLSVSVQGHASPGYDFTLDKEACLSIASALEQTEAKTAEIEKKLERSRQFYAAYFGENLQAKDIFAVNLLNQAEVDQYLNSMAPKLPASLKFESSRIKGCEENVQKLQAAHANFQSLWKQWRSLQQETLVSPLYLREALVQLLVGQEQLSNLLMEIEGADPIELTQKASLAQVSKALLLLNRQWLAALSNPRLDAEKLIVLYDSSQAILAEQDLLIETSADKSGALNGVVATDLIQRLKAHSKFLHTNSFKLLHKLRSDTQFSALGSPFGWATPITDLIKEEWQVLPWVIYDVYVTPYANELDLITTKQEFYALLLNWLSQLIGAVCLFYLIFRSSRAFPNQLSILQQSLFQKVESQVSRRLLASLFWFLKANATWISMIIGLVLMLKAAPEHWHVFRYVEVWGIAFALIRALDVIFEWLLDRAITNSGQYMSPKLVSDVGQGAEHFAMITVLSWVPVWLLYSVDAYFSVLAVALLATLITWVFAARLLGNHGPQIDKFIFSKFNRLNAETFEGKALKPLLYAGLRPVFFFLAQLFDSVDSINQRLMYFDSYRALSVRILRMRLETKDEKETEDDELEPDQSYSSWILRQVDVCSEWIEAPNTDYLYQPIKHWKEDLSEDNVLYIVGDAGSGKTSLTRHLERNWKETDVHYCHVPAKTVTPEALFQLLANALGLSSLHSVGELVKQETEIEPRVVILDDAHNLFLSDVGKLEAYRAFIQCLNAQVENVFWVVTMNSSSWSYLDCVFNRELRVSHLYQMQKWTPGEIRSLILSRHKGGRRKLKYDEMLLSAVAKNEYTNVRAADSRLFNIVWEQSQGNPMVALHLWVSAARSKNRTVEIGMPQKPDASVLKGLKDDLCFTFAAVVRHDSMTSQELVATTSYSDAIVRHALKQGMNLGILERLADRRYSVTPLWHKTLSQFLTSKNMI